LVSSKLVNSVFKVFIRELKLPNEDIDRFVFSTFLVIWDWATDVSALTSPVTKLFKSMPEPDWLTLDMISLPVGGRYRMSSCLCLPLDLPSL
jgi:hypothetical protein